MIQIIILIKGQSIPITLKGDDIIYLNYEFVADLLMSLRIKKRNIEQPNVNVDEMIERFEEDGG